jgi:hypothetical protein
MTFCRGSGECPCKGAEGMRKSSMHFACDWVDFVDKPKSGDGYNLYHYTTSPFVLGVNLWPT